MVLVLHLSMKDTTKPHGAIETRQATSTGWELKETEGGQRYVIKMSPMLLAIPFSFLGAVIGGLSNSKC
jgi:hypothetical protein